MPIRFASFLIVAYSALVMDARAGSITLYPSVDQSAEDIESRLQGVTRDGIFDYFYPGNLKTLHLARFGDPLLDIRSVMEFPPASLPPDSQIVNVVLRMSVSNTINHDDPQIFVYGYAANGVIESADFMLDKTFFGSLSGYDDFPDEGYPPTKFRELDITTAYLQNAFPQLGLTFTTNGVYPFGPIFSSTDNVSADPFAVNPNFARPALIINYSFVPEPPAHLITFVLPILFLMRSRILMSKSANERRIYSCSANCVKHFLKLGESRPA